MKTYTTIQTPLTEWFVKYFWFAWVLVFKETLANKSEKKPEKIVYMPTYLNCRFHLKFEKLRELWSCVCEWVCLSALSCLSRNEIVCKLSVKINKMKQGPLINKKINKYVTLKHSKYINIKDKNVCVCLAIVPDHLLHKWQTFKRKSLEALQVKRNRGL